MTKQKRAVALPRELSDRLAAAILTARNEAGPAQVVRVAVDGPDVAGKTTFANQLAVALKRRGLDIIRASADDFQHPRCHRYQRGALSPLGYYFDAFDYQRLKQELLAPLGPRGNQRYRRAYFDWRADRLRPAPWSIAAEGAILLLDGVFLLRPSLRHFWDVAIYVHSTPWTSLSRAVLRDGAAERQSLVHRYRKRYLPAQHGYRSACRPCQRADVIIDNNDFARPLASFQRHDLC
ncbi:MAG: hypothetical protein R3300_14455 [Candidatus Promineifilaceae bacterium]|nr:hypothetical protein [Candidatus Promineifilaceae bacterium]